ncbi:MAG: hypothetical protein GY793_05070 [Proteobacteria bacterium]|nr:hypothetical protein [Pseudomonadota bacterium]
MSAGFQDLDLGSVVIQGVFVPPPEETARKIISSGISVLNVTRHPEEMKVYGDDNGMYPCLWTVEGPEKYEACTIGHLSEALLEADKQIELCINIIEDCEIISLVYTEGVTLSDITARRLWLLIAEAGFNVEISGVKGEWLRFDEFLVPVDILLQTAYKIMKVNVNERKKMMEIVSMITTY